MEDIKFDKVELIVIKLGDNTFTLRLKVELYVSIEQLRYIILSNTDGKYLPEKIVPNVDNGAYTFPLDDTRTLRFYSFDNRQVLHV